jgi:hypothetical protein
MKPESVAKTRRSRIGLKHYLARGQIVCLAFDDVVDLLRQGRDFLLRDDVFHDGETILFKSSFHTGTLKRSSALKQREWGS